MHRLKFHLSQLFRRKSFKKEDLSETKFNRVLTVIDLIFLSLGCTVGGGAYILTGQVALEMAGPSIVMSFSVAALCSLLAGCCYAEFGSRIPRTGSAYIFIYLTLGEITAFIVGWSLILEYSIGVASAARALTANIDSMFDYQMTSFLNRTLPMTIPIIGPYPDIAAFLIVVMFASIMVFGVKESAIANNIGTSINVYVLVYIFFCGIFKSDLKNWNIKKEDIPPRFSAGNGGFFPFGVSGMLAGAATCFYSYVGFDIIATTGEEARNPERSIPLSILLSLLMVTVMYVGVATVVTLMCPYYLLDPLTPLTKVFEYVGWGQFNFIIFTGVVAALTTSIYSSLFPLPRVMYAMANDGVIFNIFATVSEKYRTPWVAIIACGILAGFIAMIFELQQLVDMLSLATLLAYTMVSKSITILRYRMNIFQDSPTNLPVKIDHEQSNSGLSGSLEVSKEHSKFVLYTIEDWFNPKSKSPTKHTEHIALVSSITLTFAVIAFNCAIVFLEIQLVRLRYWAWLVVVLLALLIAFFLILIARQPQNTEKAHFKVPLVPLFSEASAALNLLLMIKLEKITWIRFGVWMSLGFLIYFGYGIWHSKELVVQKKSYPIASSSCEKT